MKLLQPIILTLVGVLLVSLYVSNDLAFYIHPDYFTFTAAMGAILALAGLVSFVLTLKGESIVVTPKTILSIATFLLIIGVFIFGYLVPRKVLSQQTADNRGLSSRQQNAFTNIKDDSRTETVSLFGKIDTNTYSITDWITLMAANPEPSRYAGKDVTIRGFATNVTNAQFSLSKFVMTCCAVDAVTVSLDSYQPSSTPVQENDWIELQGVFTVIETENGRQLMIEPKTITPIEVPENPYYF